MNRGSSSIFLGLLLVPILLAWPDDAACQTHDVVELTSQRGDTDSVVLLDGRRDDDACPNDEVLRASGSVEVVNMIPADADCSSEIAVFSAGHAMAMHAPENGWHEEGGDVVEVALQPPLRVPVTVWLVRPNAAGEAQAAITHARAVYDENKTGIAFATRTKDMTNSPLARQATALSCENIRQLSQSDFYEQGRINVYYVNEPWLASTFYTGRNCKDDRSVIFIGPAANLATLAHEFGHAFSLFGGEKEGGHSGPADGFDDNNLMAGGGPPTRSHVSLGQAFRFNVDKRSWLNDNGVRQGPTRSCPAKQPSGPDRLCPPVSLDWKRP
jgi:hypothetical protein